MKIGIGLSLEKDPEKAGAAAVKFAKTERREITVKGRKQAIKVIECEP